MPFASRCAEAVPPCSPQGGVAAQPRDHAARASHQKTSGFRTLLVGNSDGIDIASRVSKGRREAGTADDSIPVASAREAHLYCQYCEEEQSVRARFCKVCGARLLERPAEKIAGDLGKYQFVIAQLKRWEEAGKLAPALADELAVPHRQKEAILQAALAAARGLPLPPESPVESAPASSASVLLAAPASPPAEPPTEQPNPPTTDSGGDSHFEASQAGRLHPEEESASLPTKPQAEIAPLPTKPQAESASLPTRPQAEIESLPTKPQAEIDPLPMRPQAEIASLSTKPQAEIASLPTRPQEEESAPLPSHAKEDATALAAASAAMLATHPVLEPLDLPEPPPSPEQVILERESSWSKLWQPFLSETVLWFAGPFLLLAGAFVFVKEAEGVSRALVVSGVLAVYALAFFGVGRRLALKRNLVTAGRVLTAISAAMTPLALLALQPMKAETPGLWLAVTVGLLLGMMGLQWGCAGTFGAKGRHWYLGTAGFLLLLFAVVPLTDGAPWLAALDGMALVALWLYAPAVAEAREDKGHAAFLGLGVIWLALVVFVRVHYQGMAYGFGWIQYGPLVAMLVGVVLRADRALARWQGGPSWLALLAYVALLPAAMGSVAAEWSTPRHVGPSVGLTAAIAAMLLLSGARAWRSKAFTGLSLGVGWLSFYALSGFIPFNSLLSFLGFVKELAGRDPGKPFPINYYLLPSLIYLAGVGLAYHLARRAGAQYATGAIRWFGLAMALVLIVFGHLGTDFKPAFITSAVVFAGALALSHWLVHWRLSYLSAAALVLAGLDAGLMARSTAAQPAIGLGAAALIAVGIGLVVSAERARAFRELALVAAVAAAGTALFAGTGWDACAAWAMAGAACVAVAFALGSGLPAAIGLIASGGALLHAAHLLGWPPRELSWAAYPIAFAMLAGAGLEKHPALATQRGRWFGLRLPLAADGFAIVRGPMAFAAFALAWCALALTFGSRFPALSLGAFALTHLWLARRQPSVFLLTLALIAGTAAIATGFIPRAPDRYFLVPIALCALLWSGLAVAVKRSRRVQRLIRIPARRAGITLAVHACVLAASTGALALAMHLDGKTGAAVPLTLAIASASFLVLPRWNAWTGWYYPGWGLATAAMAVLVPPGWVPLVIASGAFVPLALGLLCRRAPAWGAAAVGSESSSAPSQLGVLAKLQAFASVIACIVVEAQGLAPRATLSGAAAALALFFLLVPLLDDFVGWLALFGIGFWATIALLLPEDQVALSLGAFAAILVALGALTHPRSAPGARVLAETGLGLGAASLVAWGLGWPEPSAARESWLFGLVALALFLAPRVFRTAVFVPLAAAALSIATCLACPPSLRPASLVVAALGFSALAVTLRRWHGLARVLFDLEAHRGALQGLVASGLVASVAA
ncbi:MAG: hypothetical protein HY901_01870, partial [Deltaproteobacteria bacterium]|nr:hypothetical protein [Deltaproteobacteria bacterium]